MENPMVITVFISFDFDYIPLFTYFSCQYIETVYRNFQLHILEKLYADNLDKIINKINKLNYANANPSGNYCKLG